MSKKYLFFIIIFLGIVTGIVLINKSPDENTELNNTELNNTELQCGVGEMIFYYLDTCSWCQKVKNDGTISKIEQLGVTVRQINAKNSAQVLHSFRGVPTFIINERVYSGYKTFEELKELLGCSEEENQSLSVSEDEFLGEESQEVSLVDGAVSLEAEIFSDNLAHYYNTQLPGGKTIYFFVLKDKGGIYRAASNACQVCFDARMGFRQEGDFMVCNTCGNKYPLEKIATEKGGCNPGPINPDLKVENGKIIIKQSELEGVAGFF